MAVQPLSGRGKSLQKLAKRLRDVGYRTAVLEHAVPTWWSAEVDDNDAGAEAHLKLVLARRLGLSVSELVQHDRIVPDAPAGMRFKRSVDRESVSPPDAAQAYCASLARLIAGLIPPSDPVPADAADIRQEILAGGAQWVALNGLLDYCWTRNIAVVFVADIPGTRGMDALVYRVDGRDVIVLVRNEEKHAAWAAFHIAHELGHIALGHVRENETLADTTDVGTDDESAANAFALQVMGSANIGNFWSVFDGTEREFADVVYAEAPAARVDPEHIVLCHGREHGNFSFANRAIKFKKKKSSFPMITVNKVALEHIDVSGLPDDTAEMLAGVLQTATT